MRFAVARLYVLSIGVAACAVMLYSVPAFAGNVLNECRDGCRSTGEAEAVYKVISSPVTTYSPPLRVEYGRACQPSIPADTASAVRVDQGGGAYK